MKILCLVLSLGMVSAQSVSQLETRLKKNPNDLVTRQRLAENYERRKQFDDVVRLLAPYSNEVTTESLRRLADAYRAKKEFEKEALTLEMYLQREPDRFRPHYLLGRALRDLGKLDESAEKLRRSIQLAPKHRPSYDELLAIFVDNKQNYESRILLNDMIRVFGEKPEFLNLQCELYIKDGFLADARRTCQKAVQKNPKYPDNHVHLAQSFLDMENKKSAEKVFITAARQFPKSEYVQWATGEYYYQESNYPTAARYLRQAVKADSESARSQLGLALALFETKDYAGALPHFEKSCKLDESRVALEAFRKSASQLRQDRNKESGAYEIGLAKCGR